jgi:hypothetical protein
METLIRYSKPSKLDQAPYGTQCKVISALTADYDLYQQMSMDEQRPFWQQIDTYKKPTIS